MGRGGGGSDRVERQQAEYVTGFRRVMAGRDMVKYTFPWVWISQASLTQLKV